MLFLPQIVRHRRRCRYCRRCAGDTSFVAGPTSSRQAAVGAKEEKRDKANTVYASTYNYVQSLRKKSFLFISIDDYINISLFFSLLVSHCSQ